MELGAKLDLESQVGEPTTVWDIETGARQDVTFDPQGNPFTLTTRGLKEPFDMTGFSITKPDAAAKTKLSAAAEKDYLSGKASEPTRMATIEKATRMLTAFKSGANSGTSRGLLGLGGGQWTDQGAFDEELDSLAELAARARLKASGETRPTDADVKGNKESLFGRWKGEGVNINLLTEYIQEQVDAENAVRAIDGREVMPMPEKGNNPQKAIPKKDRKKEAEEKPKEAPKAEATKAEEKPADAPKAEATKAKEIPADAPKAEATKAEEKPADAPKKKEKK
mgnify:CR=1 FL=1